jgi:hypothetical protein
VLGWAGVFAFKIEVSKVQQDNFKNALQSELVDV